MVVVNLAYNTDTDIQARHSTRSEYHTAKEIRKNQPYLRQRSAPFLKIHDSTAQTP